MGTIVGAMLSSHAYAFLEPHEWDERRRERSMPNYARRFGSMPLEHAEIEDETLEANQRRFAAIRDGYAEIRRRLAALRADAVVMIGNDQDEIFGEGCQPQFAVYTGERFLASDHAKGTRTEYRAAPALARAILDAALESDFDPSIVLRFPDDELISHAHREALLFFDPGATQTVLPIFVKTIHPPSPSPRRCYAFGQVLRRAIEQSPDMGRVVLFSSGGLSHFAPDFPWREYRGPATLGSIYADFDRSLLAEIERGNGAALADLTSRDLFDNGDLELRQTIVMLGALGTAQPTLLRYEPFYRAIMGLVVGCWDLEPVPA
jgi:hypothetical protein